MIVPYNPDADRGDPDYRPGPDWPPSLGEIAWTLGQSLEHLTESLRRSAETWIEQVTQPPKRH